MFKDRFKEMISIEFYVSNYLLVNSDSSMINHHFSEQTRRKVWDISIGLYKTVSILKV